MTVTVRVNMVELVSARVQTTISACVRNVDVPVSHHYLTVLSVGLSALILITTSFFHLSALCVPLLVNITQCQATISQGHADLPHDMSYPYPIQNLAFF